MKDQKKTTKQQNEKITRRDFIGGAAAVAAFTIVPRHVLGGPRDVPPSKKLNIAAIGSGGMGRSNINACSGENIVALCDVDDNRAAGTFKKFPKAKKYRDFRKMLEKEDRNIDAVIVATPDHTHAVAAMAAMKRRKHVYVQKPLTRTVYEARMLTEAARKYKVATQMGNQGHSGDGVRLICEWIWEGAIGPVREVNAWTNRPIWPQGIDRPKDKHDVPPTLDWDLWLGPAPERPYHPCYLPFNWRGWWDFGCGALGDMACHLLDPVFSALKLGYPTSVQACATKVNKETFPLASIVRYEFPARGDMPSVKLNWYDGGMKPPRPDELEPGRRMTSVTFIGDKGKLMCGEYGDGPRLIPNSKMQEYKQHLPPKTIPRVKGSHEQNWIRACKGGPPACSNFDYSGPFTESVVMGNLAMRRLGRKLLWDGKNMKVTNDDEANRYVNEPRRKGWSL
jgi:predicted dehydrogenase